VNSARKHPTPELGDEAALLVILHRSARRYNPQDRQPSSVSNSSLCIHAFRMIVTANSDYFLKQPLTG
jgi:hypothetical protein